MSHPGVDGEPGTLPRELLERVLAALGLSTLPEANEQGLQRIYGAWCAHIPFDNVRKLIHLRSGQAGNLPGDDATDFFNSWLRHGVGGTCWAGNGALQALLCALGFDAHRGLATMLSSPNATPNHGTVVVSLGAHRFLLDASILHGSPLLLDEVGSGVDHPAWGVRCLRREGRWHIHWRPLHMPAGLDCRLERLPVSSAAFHERHEASRKRSPFNYSLYVRANQGESVLGIAFGQLIERRADGTASQAPLAAAERTEWLAARIGMNPGLLAGLPPDLPLPPPPRPG